LPVQKTRAIVVGSHPLGEADRIIVFYTEDFGVVRAVARGVRRIKSRLCGRLEILIYGELVFFERAGKDLHVVNSFDIVESFQSLREDLLKMAYCSYLGELIQQVDSAGVADGDTFDLMRDIMFMMKDAADPEVLARAFEIRFLSGAGFSPQLDSCVACSGDLENAPKLGFSIAGGGVLCRKCSGDSGKSGVISISRGTVELMKRMQRSPLELMTRLKIVDSSRDELRRTLKSFIRFHLDSKQFRSLEFLESIEKDTYQTLGTN